LTRTRQLVLVRHAKAEPDARDQDDHERPLAHRGRQDAARIGEELARLRLAPEYVLCSSSRRTRETFERLRAHLPGGLVVAIDRELYLASAARILARIATVEDGVGALLVVGHNPGLGELAVRLAGRGDAAQRAELRRKFPTGAFAWLRIECGWRDLARGCGTLERFAAPRTLVGGDGATA
jgi:phosphohistidine phosphatase